MLKLYSQLTKLGIVIFVVLAGLAGYATGFQAEQHFNWQHIVYFILGIFFLSSGSLALNQVQEHKLDRAMKRTSQRPVASGRITPAAAGIFSVVLVFLGLHLLLSVSLLSALLGALTLSLYNGLYTYYLKPKWIYAAVPGAVPGALPVTMGYAAVNPDIFNSESVYLFLILFLWQMPHFWALALRFKDDYAEGGIPTLPVALGIDRTLHQMGMYTLVYAGVALASPFFLRTSWVYIVLVVPISLQLIREFRRYFRHKGESGWLRFFMWVNISVLVYLFAPVMDKWGFVLIR